jgi:hypothetical protein
VAKFVVYCTIFVGTISVISLVEVFVIVTGVPEMVEVMVYGQNEVEMLVTTVETMLVTGVAVTKTS